MFNDLPFFVIHIIRNLRSEIKINLLELRIIFSSRTMILQNTKTILSTLKTFSALLLCLDSTIFIKW